MKSFDPCLAEATVYKWKTATKMAEKLGFPTETHKLLKVSPIVKEGELEKFPAMILELNFGSKALFSSGTYMQCLECSGFNEDSMLKSSETFTVCVEHEFLVMAAKDYVDTIRFFGPRKCNCQSYVFFLLSILGVQEYTLLNSVIVETDQGYISNKVKLLAGNHSPDRPTCTGDPHPMAPKHSKVKIDRNVPTTFEQFELDEFRDAVGQRYIHLFGMSLFMFFSLLVLLCAMFI